MALIIESSIRHKTNDYGDCFDESSENERMFQCHQRYDLTYDISGCEFYDNVSSTSTPSTLRSSELLHHRKDYDTDDSGFYDSAISDSDLLLMSSLCLRDECQSEHTANTWCSDGFPLPKLYLLSHFDEHCEEDVDSKPCSSSHSGCTKSTQKSSTAGASKPSASAVPEYLHSERTSIRRQRSPDAIEERCSRHRLSLDSYLECRYGNSSSPTRRSSDSLLIPHASEKPCSDLSDTEVCSTDQHIMTADCLSLGLASMSRSQNSQSYFPPLDHGGLDNCLQCVLAEFSPPSLSQLIGRKIGLDHVDILSKLSNRGMSVVIRRICGHLADTDLCNLILVSIKWRNIITSDKCIMKRVRAQKSRLRLVATLRSKENVPKTKTPHGSGLNKSSTTSAVVTRPLRSCANISSLSADVATTLSPTTCSTDANKTSKSNRGVSKMSPMFPSSHRARHFWKEAEKLYVGETLTKCPRCRGPSRTSGVEDRGRCVSTVCLFDFCLQCLSPYHSSHACRTAAPSPHNAFIGSRRSKRQLRRL